MKFYSFAISPYFALTLSFPSQHTCWLCEGCSWDRCHFFFLSYLLCLDRCTKHSSFSDMYVLYWFLELPQRAKHWLPQLQRVGPYFGDCLLFLSFFHFSITIFYSLKINYYSNFSLRIFLRANIDYFCKKANSKYFTLRRPCNLCLNHSTLLIHKPVSVPVLKIVC